MAGSTSTAGQVPGQMSSGQPPQPAQGILGGAFGGGMPGNPGGGMHPMTHMLLSQLVGRLGPQMSGITSPGPGPQLSGTTAPAPALGPQIERR